MWQDMVEEWDVPALEGITDITYGLLPDGPGFTISFSFAPNDFFTDEQVSVSFRVANFFVPGEEPSVETVEASTIHWKKGKDLTVLIKKARGGGGGSGGGGGGRRKGKKGKGGRGPAGGSGGKDIREPRDSFFRFFTSVDVQGVLMQGTDEDRMELMQQVDLQYQLATALRTDIIPRAVKWFTGEAEEEDDDENDEDWDPELDGIEEGDEDEDGDSEDEEGEGAASRMLAAAMGGAAVPAGGEGDEEEEEEDE